MTNDQRKPLADTNYELTPGLADWARQTRLTDVEANAIRTSIWELSANGQDDRLNRISSRIERTIARIERKIDNRWSSTKSSVNT
jgi:hypothetical protein